MVFEAYLLNEDRSKIYPVFYYLLYTNINEIDIVFVKELLSKTKLKQTKQLQLLLIFYLNIFTLIIHFALMIFRF